MDGGIEHIARAHTVALGMDVELQLDRSAQRGFQPVLVMLRDARERAVAAMTQLVICDPTDSLSIRRLQMEIAVFDDMVNSCRAIVARGREVERIVSEEERAEINDLIMNNPQWATAEISGATGVNDR